MERAEKAVLRSFLECAKCAIHIAMKSSRTVGKLWPFGPCCSRLRLVPEINNGKPFETAKQERQEVSVSYATERHFRAFGTRCTA